MSQSTHRHKGKTKKHKKRAKLIPYYLIPSKLEKGQENPTVQLPKSIYDALHFLFDPFDGDGQKIIQFLTQIQKLMRIRSNQYPAVIKESDIAGLVQQITGKNWLLKSRSNYRSNIHHVTPKSRLKKGEEEQTVQLPELFHTAWHRLFDNLYGKEIIEFVQRFQELMRHKNTITEKEITSLQQEIKSENLNSLINQDSRKEVQCEGTRRLYPVPQSTPVPPMR